MGFWRFFKKYHVEILLFGAAFSVRILFLIAIMYRIPVPFIGSDSQSYIDTAKGFLATGHFINADGAPNSYEMPAYPLFLAFFIRFFADLKIVSVVQGVLAGISTVLLYRISLFITKPIALTGALLFAFDPAGIFYSNFIVTEPLFIFFILAFLFFLITRRDALLSGACVPGVLLGIATMIRPVGEILLPAVLVFYLVGKSFSLRRAGVFLSIFVIGWLAVVGALMIRNKILFGGAELSAVASWQLYHSHAPHFYAYKNGIAERDAERLFQERLEIVDPYKEEVRRGNVGSLRHAPYMWQVGLDYIRQYPFQFGFFHIAKTAPFFISDGLRQIARDIKLHAVPSANLGSLALRGNAKGLFNALIKDPTTLMLFSVGFLFWLGINIMMVIGSVALLRSPNSALRALTLFLLLAILLTALVAGGAVAHPRYRYSVSPFMFILAAVGLSQIRMRRRG